MIETLSPIPYSTLAYILDFVGPPAPLSPRTQMGEAEPPTPRQRVDLAVAGYTVSADDPFPRPSFVPIAEILLRPTTVVDLRLWKGFDATWTRVAFAGNNGVTVTDANNGAVIAGPIDGTDLAELVMPMIGGADADADGIEPGVEFEMHTDHATAAALAALVDVARSAVHSGAPATAFPIGQVLDFAVAAPADLPAGSMRLQSRIMSRATAIPARDHVGEGLRKLAEAEVVTLDPTSASLSGPLLGLASLLPPHPPAFRWQRRTVHDADAVSTTDRIVNFGLSGLIVEVGLGAPDHVAWRTRTTDDVIRDLAGELAIVAHRS